MDSVRTTSSKFLSVALIVPVLPNLMNRDDQGRPKTVYFGGSERLSPSSQFLKRAWRRASINGKTLLRSQYVPEILIRRMEEARGTLTDVQKENITKAFWEGFKTVGKTEGLLFFSDTEIHKFVDALIGELETLSIKKEKKDKKGKDKDEKEKAAEKAAGKKVDAALGKVYAEVPASERLTLSLYGRMFAGANTALRAIPDGALQVSRAISTNRVSLQSDYFTAVDDYRQDSEDENLADVGAAFLGDRAYAPGCNLLIQYSIDLNLLLENADLERTPENLEELSSVVMDFLETSIFRPLSGAACQGSFAISPRPYYAAVMFPKRGSLYDLGGAFLESRREASPEEDVDRLTSYMEKVESKFQECDSKVEFCLDGGTSKTQFLDQVRSTLVSFLL